MSHTLPRTFCPSSACAEQRPVASGLVSPKALRCTKASTMRSQHGCRLKRSVCAKAKLDTRQQQDLVREARSMQIDATKVLALLLEAPDARQAAAEHVGSLTEQFFAIASTYLTMAEKEGDAAVGTRLRSVLTVAMEEKQKTLRPEIQLLNRLLAAETSAERKQVLNTAAAGDTLQMNAGYFFRLLEHMTADVKRQPENAGKAPLVARLEACRAEALERLPPSWTPAR